MEFDLDKVLGAFDAHKAKMGMVGWGGNSIAELEEEVRTKKPRTLMDDGDTNIVDYPFATTKGDYRYFYPREKQHGV